MVALRPVVLASLLVSLLSAGCAGNDADAAGGDAGPTAGLLEGVVVDDAIRPVAGARVELDGGLANATTEADGLFRFPEVAPGAHVVRALKPGYADAVTQVIVAASEPTPLVKLVLVVDASSLPYATMASIEGFIECGLAFPPSYHFAACGGPNVASLIACSATDGAVCLGNVTGDRYIVVEWLEQVPTFLAIEVVWTPTQALGDTLWVLAQSSTPEQLEMVSASTHNDTSGPSPLYVSMDPQMVADSGIGRDAYFMSQVFAECTEGVPACGGAVVQQRFTMYLATFYGFQPPTEWRFTQQGSLPSPPQAS